MRHFLRFGWAATIGLAVAGAAVGQQPGTGSGTGTGSGSGSTGSTTTTLAPPPAITGMDTSSGARSTSTAVNASNALGAYYANPYYQGRAGASGTDAPGGFGTPLYSTSGGTGGTGGRIGSTTGGRTGSTTGGTSSGFGGTSSSSSGFGGTSSTGFGGTSSSGFGGTSSSGFGAAGGRGGQGGFGGQGMGLGGSGTTSAAQVIALPRPISYTAHVRFATPPMTAPRMHTEVRAVLDRSISLSNPRGIEVVSDGVVVVLRGTVRDEDEARLAEGMVRLSPGVRDVKNELKFPNP